MTVSIGASEWMVHLPGEWENELTEVTTILDTWYAVSKNDGIKVYFGDEADAFAFANLKAARDQIK
jgi:hypothetical protein